MIRTSRLWIWRYQRWQCQRKLGKITRLDVGRLLSGHREALRTQFDGCLIFLATLSLILIAFIIAGMR